MIKKYLLIAVIVNLAACAGVRTSDQTYTAHAENFNILFLQIPGGDTQKKALGLVPKGADIKTINATPKDTTSLIGVLNRILGIDITVINGTVKKSD